jgi:hypothetical protein
LPTPGSRASAVVQAPAWLVRLLTPLVARQIARELAKKHPGLSPGDIGEKMRADLPSGPDREEGERMIAAVVARLPPTPEKIETEGRDGKASAVVLVAANLLPLYGVLVWNWEVFPLLLLFWMENVIIGLLNVARMLLFDPADLTAWLAKLFMVPFFCVHYGMFTFLHGVFVFGLFGGGKDKGNDLVEPVLRALEQWSLWLPLGALAASHLFSFLWNYLWRGEFRRASVRQLMTRPYSRVFVLHFTILLGGWGVMVLGSPLWALLILIGFKIAIDLKAHLKERRVLQSAHAG